MRASPWFIGTISKWCFSDRGASFLNSCSYFYSTSLSITFLILFSVKEKLLCKKMIQSYLLRLSLWLVGTCTGICIFCYLIIAENLNVVDCLARFRLFHALITWLSLIHPSGIQHSTSSLGIFFLFSQTGLDAIFERVLILILSLSSNAYHTANNKLAHLAPLSFPIHHRWPASRDHGFFFLVT